MAFKHANPQIGDVRTLNRDISAIRGTILKGSRVEIIGSSPRGWEIRDLESGEELGETMHWDIFERE